MRRILVTGGAGFIGSNLVRFLQRRYPDVALFNLDALTYAASLENLADLPDPHRHTFLHQDIRDAKAMREIVGDYRIDTIIHLAAESHVDRSIHAPHEFMETNILGTFNLLQAARVRLTSSEEDSASRIHFHHISTDEVYGSLSSEAPPFSEATPYAPNSPYAASKAASDHLVRSFAHTYGLPATITNCSNNYGPRQFPEKLVPLVILNALRGEPIPIYGDGKQVRDWLYVDDHCEAISLVLERGKVGEVYNVGGVNQPTNLEIVELICAELDERFPDAACYPHRSLITRVRDRPGHDRRYAMNIGKIQAELGWSPRHSLKDGLRLTIDWYLANQSWIEAIEARPSYEEWLTLNYRERQEVA